VDRVKTEERIVQAFMKALGRIATRFVCLLDQAQQFNFVNKRLFIQKIKNENQGYTAASSLFAPFRR
jgi:hypothetical protein